MTCGSFFFAFDFLFFYLLLFVFSRRKVDGGKEGGLNINQKLPGGIPMTE